MANDRKTLLIGVEKESLMEFRKILFEKGLSPNEFFCFIVDLVNIKDERFLDFIEEVKNNKLEKLMKGEAVKYTSDNLYDAIEEKLKKY